MQCVILAAGRGDRMGTLTEGTPKALLEVAGKTLLEHKLDALPPQMDEVIIVVGYMGSSIQRYLGGLYEGKHLFYVEDDKIDGTAGALWRAQSFLKDTFLVMNGDDIYAEEDIASAAKADRWSVVGLEADELGSAARIKVDKHGRVKNILESDERDGSSGYLNTGLYRLDTTVFNVPLVQKSPGSPEYGLPQTLVHSGSPFWLIPGTFWLQITTPEDLAKAEKALKERRT